MIRPDCFSGVNHLLLCSSFVSAYCLSERRRRRRRVKPVECKFGWRGRLVAMRRITELGWVKHKWGGGGVGGRGWQQRSRIYICNYSHDAIISRRHSSHSQRHLTSIFGRHTPAYQTAAAADAPLRQLLLSRVPPTSPLAPTGAAGKPGRKRK